MSININWLNAITYKVINPTAVYDIVFKNAALLAYLRKNRFRPYTGGVSIDDAFIYGVTNGGAYLKGEPFNIDVVEPIAGKSFTPRYEYETVSDYLENIPVNSGKAAVFNHLAIKQKVALNSINTKISVALWRHGQSVSAPLAEDRTRYTNGLEEFLNDGVTQSYFGHIFSSYGGQTRNDGNVGEGYNSVPFFCGNSTTGAAGQITYNKVVRAIMRATKGDRMPDLGLGNKGVFEFLLERIQAQQIFEFKMGEGTATWGATSIKVLKTNIMVDEYAPSATSMYGVADPKLGDYSTPATVTISGSPATGSNLPSSGTYVPGEVLALLNSDTLAWHNSTHPLFNFGWTGYKPAQNSSLIAGQILNMGTMIGSEPWLNTVMMGINS
jgi:hypothetical protein